MKKPVLIILALLAQGMLYAEPNGTPAAFNNIGTARASAMGGAYVAVANDASSVFYNPAGIVNSDYKDITFMYAKQKWLVPYNYFAFIYPINKSRGAGIGMMISGDTAMMEQTYILSYCENLDWFQNIVKGVNLGLNFKLQFANFGEELDINPDAVNGSAWGIGLDFGILWALTEQVQAGIMIKDGFSMVKWDTTHNPDSVYEGVPMTVSAGFRWAVKGAMFSAEFSDLDMVKLGVEYTVFDYIDLRAGYNQMLDFEAYKQFMIGLGIGRFEFGMRREFSMNIDTAFVFERFDNTLKIQTSFKFK